MLPYASKVMRVKQRFFTVGQTAEILGHKEGTIRAWIASGRLKALRIGYSIRVPAEVIEKLINDARPAGK